MKISTLLLSFCLGSTAFSPSIVFSEPVENEAQPALFIIAGSGVKLHAEPAANAKEIIRLPIGSVLNKIGKSPQTSLLGQDRDYWYKVALADGKQGWVFGSFMVAVDRSRLIEKYIEISEAQLKVDPPIFKDLVEVVSLLDRITIGLPASEKVGELKLLKLLTVERSLTVITPEQEKVSPYKEWLVAQAPILLRNEMMAGWMLNSAVFWKLSSEYAETPLGDKVAWVAANSGLGGECELDLSCHLARVNRTLGKYLEIYPNGTQLESALIQCLDEVKNLQVLSKEQSAPANAQDKIAFSKQIALLKQSLSKVEHPLKERLFSQLEKIVY
ncbi:MAG: SH3 domain-containing protein [Thiotrichaceae bacterium]|nr:SH3 domain-containing protein [Thiotrichaceae bacterium]